MWKRLRLTPTGRETSPWTPPIVAILIFIVLIVFTGIFLVQRGWLDGPGYVELIGGGAFTSLGALTAAMLLYWRWSVDHKTQVKRHREQERNNRQEKMGERLAQAVTHLGQGQGFMQVSGLIELAGLVDDWWSIGNEMLRDTPDDDHVERAAVRAMVKLRRQEIIDLMFKHTLQPDSVGEDEKGGSAETQRKTMVQDARSQILIAHLPAPDEAGNVRDESWAQLDLSHAYLVNAKLEGAHLQQANLQRAHLTGANLTAADLTGANLERATMVDSNNHRAQLTGADLTGVDLTNAEMMYMNLTRANLQVATLCNANLTLATITQADFCSADLTGARLRTAKIDGTHLQWANLTDARLDRFYKGSPRYSDDTQFPDFYDPETAGFTRTERDPWNDPPD
ncbi:pentapeptide repeat-containing protein [Corynebacterium sp. AOP34-AQ2-28]|uniref:pentapeptide repeat-containing protein n=1 Tax=Corynebacterium sp. AOP34-AQ2-28 TaxID=3457689 RepID=UPI0040342356